MKKRAMLAVMVASALLLASCGGDGDSAGDTTTTAQETTTTVRDDDNNYRSRRDNNYSRIRYDYSKCDSGRRSYTADTDLGTILVNSDGFALYFFTPDTDGESTCYDACATAWPPVSADEATGSELDSSLFGSTTRTDGMEQLTVNGKPVYLFAADSNSRRHERPRCQRRLVRHRRRRQHDRRLTQLSRNSQVRWGPVTNDRSPSFYEASASPDTPLIPATKLAIASATFGSFRAPECPSPEVTNSSVLAER